MAKEGKKKTDESPVLKFMPLIVLCAVLVYAALAYLLLFMPKLGKFMDGGEYDIRPLEVQLRDDTIYLSEVKAAVEEYKQINDAHKRKLDLMIPPNEDMPGLFVQFDEIATKNGMVLSSIDTIVDGEEETASGTKTVRISANFIGGTYEEFILLLNDIERLVRIADVQSISFSSGGMSYSVAMTAYFIDEDIGLERVADEMPLQIAP